MPYIKQVDRHILDEQLRVPENAGELNYLFTRLCLDYIRAKGESYQHYNDCMGALTGALHELYRRGIGPYENEAIKKNGDI